jgi:hypothetical protein
MPGHCGGLSVCLVAGSPSMPSIRSTQLSILLSVRLVSVMWRLHATAAERGIGIAGRSPCRERLALLMHEREGHAIHD